jgi:flagellar hook-associated protein 1 FlgK
MGANLLDMLRLSQDAAGTARAAALLATENLAGARDATYVKRISNVEIDVAGGHISALRTGATQRVIDGKIVETKRTQHSTVQRDKAKQELFELFDDLNGPLDGKGSIDKKLLILANKAAVLTQEAASPIFRRNMIESVKEFVTTVNSFADGINSQRNFAERGVSTSVQNINDLAEQLHVLNKQLGIGSGPDLDLTILTTEREKVVEAIAQIIDIQVVSSENSLFVYTMSGTPIVEGRVYPLGYSSSGVIDYSAEYPANINPIYTINDAGVRVDITPQITKGKLGGYLEMRDQVYPKYQKTLDKFTQVFQEQMNKLHNKGSGFPPASELNGKLFVSATEKDTEIAWKADSVVRIALIDDKGKFADLDGGAFYVDINLNVGGVNAMTPANIQSEINTVLGSGVAVFSEGDDHGYLTLKAPAGFRIAIGSVDGTIPGETSDGVGFSEYFHLNDLFESSPDAMGRGYSNTFKLNSKIQKDTSLLAVGKLNSSTSIAITGSVENTTAIASGDNINLTELRDLINSPVVSFDAAGVMAAETTSFLSYISTTVNLIHLDTSAAIEQTAFTESVLDGLEKRHSMISGVNQDEESAEVLMQKMYYRGILNTYQHLIDMLTEMLDAFGRM